MDTLRQCVHVSFQPSIPRTASPGFLAALPQLLADNQHRCRAPNMILGRVDFQGVPHAGQLSREEQDQRLTGRPAAFVELEQLPGRIPTRQHGGYVRVSIQSYVHPELWVSCTMKIPSQDEHVSMTNAKGRLSSGASAPHVSLTRHGANLYSVRVDDRWNLGLWMQSASLPLS